MRKWEFVEYFLKEIREKLPDFYEELSTLIANVEKVDDFMEKNYNWDTDDWELDEEMHKDEMIYLINEKLYKEAFKRLHVRIAMIASYCTACEAHGFEDFVCIGCKFEEEYGKCNTEDSLYVIITKAFENIEGKMKFD
jgi:hypothetical protein